MSEGRDLRRVAYHEAGHAVAAAVLGVPSLRVFMGGVMRDDLNAGVEQRQPATALRQLDVIVAGNVAESILTGSEVKPLADGTGGGDYSAAVETLRGVHLPSGARTVQGQARERFEGVRSLLTKQWPAVVAVASRLESAGDLTAHQVRALVARP